MIDPGDTFAAEARELFEQLEEALLALEAQPDDRALIDTVFRALHTLKGSGGMFGPPALAAFAHEVETAVDRVRQGEESPSRELISVLLRSTDHLRLLLDQPDKVDAAATAALCAALGRPLGGVVAPAAAADTVIVPAPGEERHWRVRLCLPVSAMAFGTNPVTLLDELRQLGACTVTTVTDGLPHLSELDPGQLYLRFDVLLSTARPRQAIEDVFIFVDGEEAVQIEELPRKPAGPVNVDLSPVSVGGDAAAPAAPTAISAGQSSEKQGDKPEASVRVAAPRLDALLDQVGELVIAQARLTALANARKDPALSSAVEEIERLSAELRESTMGMRMLPIGTLFGRYRRVVRDLSQELGKTVELVTAGEATELDKTVIERLGDPLVHMIRNAIDHGLEGPAARAAAGKPACGTVSLEARQAGAEVLITLRDDGAGLDRARIRAKAIERGLIAADATMGDRDVDQLIFHPGFSTAAALTSLSGRGVGMDVVKRTIEDLRGTVEVSSQPGRGTAVTLKLPLTLAIIDGLLVRVGLGMCVLPLAVVEECVELKAAEHKGSNGRSFLSIRGSLVPFLRLPELFGVAPQASEEMVVIVASEHGRVGLVVDQVVGHHQTVIKSLSPLHRGITGFAGATILGDGRVALILDIAALVQAAHAQHDEAIAA